MSEAKPFVISKWQVMRAFEWVKANAGAAGVDKQSLSDYEGKLTDNLYTLWNRLSSGSYFPPPVKAVAIPKKAGGERLLGVPTVSDRIAQMVVKLEFEPQVEPHFYLILMVTGRINQHWMRWASRGSVVGATTGYLSLILRGCSTIYRTIYYLKRSINIRVRRG